VNQKCKKLLLLKCRIRAGKTPTSRYCWSLQRFESYWIYIAWRADLPLCNHACEKWRSSSSIDIPGPPENCFIVYRGFQFNAIPGNAEQICTYEVSESAYSFFKKAIWIPSSACYQGVILWSLAFIATAVFRTHKYGFPEHLQRLIDTLSATRKIILAISGSPYTLSYINDTRNVQSVLVSYLDTPAAEYAAAQVIFGGIPAQGKLPVSGSSAFPVHTGLMTEASRLMFIRPEEIGIASAN